MVAANNNRSKVAQMFLTRKSNHRGKFKHKDCVEQFAMSLALCGYDEITSETNEFLTRDGRAKLGIRQVVHKWGPDSPFTYQSMMAGESEFTFVKRLSFLNDSFLSIPGIRNYAHPTELARLPQKIQVFLKLLRFPQSSASSRQYQTLLIFSEESYQFK